MPDEPRTLTGLVVPFNVPGSMSLGRFHFDAESVAWSVPERVKLLVEHAQGGIVVGHGVEFDVREDGLYGTFAIDDDPTALAALSAAARMLRDGLSIGIELTDEVMTLSGRNPRIKAGTRAQGLMREVSLVAVPAFDESRVTDVTGLPKTIPAAAAAGTITTPGVSMSKNLAVAHGPHLATAAAPTGLSLATGNGQTAAGQQGTSTQAVATGDQGNTTQDGAQGTSTAASGAQTAQGTQTPTDGQNGAQGAATGSGEGQATASAPPRAAAGAAFTSADGGPVYDFSGGGHSMVLDIFAARDGDDDAASRLRQFSLAMREPGSQQLALAGVARVAGGPGALNTGAVVVRNDDTQNITRDDYRPDMLLRAIDLGRPLVSRVRQLPISGPNPFRLPTFGEFDGVGDHTEGQAHRPEGTIDDVGGQVVVPVAQSGAFRLSRELAESTGPAIDQLVVGEMIKDYRRGSEARLVATLEATKAVHDAFSIDTPAELLAQLIAFYTARQESPTVIGMGGTAYNTFAIATAQDGRPYFPYLGPTNAAGTSAAGLTALNVQGVAGVPAWSADAIDLWMLNGEDVAVFESAPRTFRFEEVEGPGIIKLAIWGYQAAHVFRSQGVRRLRTTAA